jgi:hypothetical protein
VASRMKPAPMKANTMTNAMYFLIILIAFVFFDDAVDGTGGTDVVLVH